MKYFLLFIMFLYLGCAGTREPVKEEPVEETKPQYDESFDPLSLDDDDIIIADASVTKHENENQTAIIEEKIIPKEINGFRVQILATKNIETASLFKQEATERFGSLEHETYLIYEVPLYKIRIGDCKERSEAEDLRDLAKQYRYREAFIVKCKIKVVE
ncbi:hypothetical protein ES705_13767 [subsurface metagenome]